MREQDNGTILVVDDTRANVELLTSLLTREGYSLLTATDGQEALDVMARELPDLMICDVMMPKLNGFEVCRQLKQNPATRMTPVVLLTALQEREDKIQGINAGADDFLTKPVNPHELRARVRSLVRLKRYTDALDAAELVIINLAITIEARDAHTDGHCQRLGRYAVALGQCRDVSEDDLSALWRGAILHDLGKVTVPEAILLKPGPLTASECELMKRHVVTGEEMCVGLSSLTPVRPIVRHHHERLDGSGYPDGLRGDAVPLLAQIVGLVDTYDALTTDRPYRRAFAPAEAHEQLFDEVRKGWRDVALVDALVGLSRTGQLDRPVEDRFRRPRTL